MAGQPMRILAICRLVTIVLAGCCFLAFMGVVVRTKRLSSVVPTVVNTVPFDLNRGHAFAAPDVVALYHGVALAFCALCGLALVLMWR
jgi:hypothetical protein